MIAGLLDEAGAVIEAVEGEVGSLAVDQEVDMAVSKAFHALMQV